MIKDLFGDKAVIIGWDGTTGWQIVDIMLGGYGDKPNPGTWNTPNFWDELGAGSGDAVKVRNAWLKVARSINWGGNILDRFCVVDPDGKLHGGTDPPLVA